ncbi:hypothetical protein vseg_011344 [Gypsophila vaccaria]
MLTSLTKFIRCQKTLVQNQGVQLFFLRSLHKEPIPVSWKKPKVGWTKLNFDGSLKYNTGKASIGGVFRDHKAEFLLGYAESIGNISSSNAELAALCRGLELILENGWTTDVWLEGDAKGLVNVVGKKRLVKSTEAQKYVNYINEMIPELDNFVMSHIYREGNRAADKFAQLGHDLETPRIWERVPPDEVLDIMQDDAQGKIVLRTR